MPECEFRVLEILSKTAASGFGIGRSDGDQNGYGYRFAIFMAPKRIDCVSTRFEAGLKRYHTVWSWKVNEYENGQFSQLISFLVGSANTTTTDNSARGGSTRQEAPDGDTGKKSESFQYRLTKDSCRFAMGLHSYRRRFDFGSRSVCCRDSSGRSKATEESGDEGMGLRDRFLCCMASVLAFRRTPIDPNEPGTRRINSSEIVRRRRRQTSRSASGRSEKATILYERPPQPAADRRLQTKERTRDGIRAVTENGDSDLRNDETKRQGQSGEKIQRSPIGRGRPDSYERCGRNWSPNRYRRPSKTRGIGTIFEFELATGLVAAYDHYRPSTEWRTVDPRLLGSRVAGACKDALEAVLVPS